MRKICLDLVLSLSDKVEVTSDNISLTIWINIFSFPAFCFTASRSRATSFDNAPKSRLARQECLAFSALKCLRKGSAGWRSGDGGGNSTTIFSVCRALRGKGSVWVECESSTKMTEDGEKHGGCFWRKACSPETPTGLFFGVESIPGR